MTAPVWSRQVLAQLMRERYGDPERLAAEALLPVPKRPVSPADRAVVLDAAVGGRGLLRRRAMAEVNAAMTAWELTRSDVARARVQAALAAHAVLTAGDVA